MDFLIRCKCGHRLDNHTPAGCRGDRSEACGCPRDRESALASAVDSAANLAVAERIELAQSDDAAAL